MQHPSLTHTVIALGVALRVALAIALPPQSAYDDHFEPVRRIVEKGRIPDPRDCWECYQPPLYYLVSVGVFVPTRAVADWLGVSPERSVAAGRKGIQFVSAVVGALTLVACLGVLRLACGQLHRDRPAKGRRRRTSRIRGPITLTSAREALALAFVAFLPRHVYMSAMATNDAITYLFATLTILAVLDARRRRWPAGRCLLAGALAGATVLCKGYGVVVVAVIAVCLAWFGWLLARRMRRFMPKRPRDVPPAPKAVTYAAAPRRRSVAVRWFGTHSPLALFLAAAVVVGCWPTVRNLVLFDRFHVDNYSLFPGRTPMEAQPPGSVGETSFASFRLVALVQHPWVHVAHADSFWTQMYGRLWFDYEGFNTSLAGYAPWQAHWDRLRDEWELNRPGQHQWPPQRWRALLDYANDDVPPNLQRVARVSYAAGLPLTACVLVGLVLAARRFGRDFVLTLLVLNLVGALCVPLFQTLRLPHFAAMKAAFALCGLCAIPVLVVLVANIRRAWITQLVLPALWLAATTIVIADAAYVLCVADILPR